MAYEGDIMLANGITQANHQNYALIEASAVYIDDNNRLTDKLSTIDDAIGGINDDRGVAGGIATLNNSGVLDPNQVPSYTVNVLEGYIDPSDGATITHFYATRSGSAPGYIYTDAYSPEANKFYTELTSNRIYRWNGSAYIEVSKVLELGTTATTAFAGDKGDSAYTHAVTNKGSAFSSGFYKITTNGEGHVTAATSVDKSDITSFGIPDLDGTVSSVSYNSSDHTIKQTINGTTTDIVSAATLKTDMGIANELYYKADRINPAFAGTINLGRNTTRINPDTGEPYRKGVNSVALGHDLIVSGDYALAENYGTMATGNSAHSQGQSTEASGYCSHAEGRYTKSSGDCSHVEGKYTEALGDYQHVFGVYNIGNVIPRWVPDESYVIGDRVIHYKTNSGGVEVECIYICIVDNSDHEFDLNNWDEVSSANVYNSDYVEIVGNGINTRNRSNARTLDWEGNEWLAGGLTVNQNGITIGSTTLTEADLIALLALLNGQS